MSTTESHPARMSEHETSVWERVRGALRRDWEQTLFDFGVKSAVELRQGVTDTVKQAVGVERIPGPTRPNSPEHFDAVRFGYLLAGDAYGDARPWGDEVEARLQLRWERQADPLPWKEVRAHVRYGWDYRRHEDAREHDARVAPTAPAARRQAERLVDVIKDFRVAMFVTQSPEGRSARVQVRPMTVAEVRENGDLVFASTLTEAKAREIEQNEEVTAVFQAEDEYVTVTGKASVSRDRAEIERLWSDAWKVFFPAGSSDPDLCLLRVESREGEYWDLSGATGVRFFLNTARAFVADDPTDAAP